MLGDDLQGRETWLDGRRTPQTPPTEKGHSEDTKSALPTNTQCSTHQGKFHAILNCCYLYGDAASEASYG
jgi:hypothetical protein